MNGRGMGRDVDSLMCGPSVPLCKQLAIQQGQSNPKCLFLSELFIRKFGHGSLKAVSMLSVNSCKGTGSKPYIFQSSSWQR